MIPRWLQRWMPQFRSLVHFSLSLSAIPSSSVSLLFPLSPCTHALTPQPLCCPRAWLLTDAGWECRAQLGLIAAVYLIKTWEDPTGAKARGRHKAVFIDFEHRCTHSHTSTSWESKEDRCFPLSSEARLMLPPERLCVCKYILEHIWLYYFILSSCVFYCVPDLSQGVAHWQPVLHYVLQVASQCEAIQTRIIGKEWGGTTRVLKER